MLLLIWRKSSEPTKKPVCDSITPSSLPQHDSSTPCKDSVSESIKSRCMPDCMLTPLSDESVITYIQLSGVQGVNIQEHVLLTIQSQFSDINLSFVSQQANASQVIDDVINQLSFDDTKLNGWAGFPDVARSGIESYGLSHHESFRVDDLDLNLNKPIDLNVSQMETQYELFMFEEPDVVKCQEPIVVEEDESAPSDGQFFNDDEGRDTLYETEYDVQSSENVGTNDDDEDEEFLVDEEHKLVEPDVDVHLFGISMYVLFDNIGVTNIIPDDVLEGEDVDVINADGFNSDPGEDDEKSNYIKRRLDELSREMKGVINASGQ
uniref:Uncharacterized protein n=1 Tax=Tanacetum cinerariifolium TaxID=118510 RepID=A0A6L2N9N8_TANCI|nr:hypothetical protein [Tanacetum cinerariifolium]